MRPFPEAEPSAAQLVNSVITSRRSVRGFLPDPVSATTIREILAVASRAPSMTNTQPWRVYVVTGAARDRLSAEISASHARGEEPEAEYAYYPREWRSPYIDRRRQIGWALYGLLGIVKGDREATARQHRRNYDFFGAPVGMIFTLDRTLGYGSWLDLGMFMQNIMISARGRGLDTCPQAAFKSYHVIIRRLLNVPDQEMIVCGMALGRVDPEAPANQLQSPREPVEAFAKFLDD